jgi:hypothetical protein
MIQATILFTPGGKLTPEPLHESFRTLLGKFRNKIK